MDVQGVQQNAHWPLTVRSRRLLPAPAYRFRHKPSLSHPRSRTLQPHTHMRQTPQPSACNRPLTPSQGPVNTEPVTRQDGNALCKSERQESCQHKQPGPMVFACVCWKRLDGETAGSLVGYHASLSGRALSGRLPCRTPHPPACQRHAQQNPVSWEGLGRAVFWVSQQMQQVPWERARGLDTTQTQP